MKKSILITSLLSFSLVLSSCGKKDSPTTTTKTTTNKATINTDVNLDKEIKKSASEEDTKSINKESLKELMNNSDYITRVKIQVDTDNKTTSNFIEDFKGDLSNVEFQLPKSLTPSKEYLIFYVDGPNGEIVPTDIEKSFIEIDGSDDKTLDYIESNYTREFEIDTNKKDTKSTKKDSTSKSKTTSKTNVKEKKDTNSKNKKSK